jgi:hypothetical protein
MIDPRIPLMIQQPNVLAALDAGTTAASNQANVLRQAEGQNLFRQYGAAAMQGDRNALAQIAGFDPIMGQNMQAGQLDMQATRQEMDLTNLRIEDVRRQAKEAARAQQDAATAAAELQQSRALMTQAGQAFLRGDQQTFGAVAAEFGVPDLPMNEQGLKFLDAIVSGFDEGLAGIAPAAPEAPQWRPAAPEEAAMYGATAGQINDKTGEFKRTPVDSTMEIVTNPDGTMAFRQGPGAGESEGRIAPSSPQYMIDSIEGILNDPALDFATGWRAWTQNIPGTDARRFGARARQLEGQAFLQAFESLKGGGQITEVEGLKATQAIGRLDTAQKPEDYRAALTELRDILKAAQGRPQGWAQTQGQAPASRAREVEINGQRFRVEPLDE